MRRDDLQAAPTPADVGGDFGAALRAAPILPRVFARGEPAVAKPLRIHLAV